MEFKWIDGYEISVSSDEDCVTLSCNKEGLLSLANHLITLASKSSDTHFHLDENNSLAEGSKELIVEKVNR